VEDLDNANSELPIVVESSSGTVTDSSSRPDLKFLRLWAPVVKHLSDDDEEIVTKACWVCGTAVQVRCSLLGFRGRRFLTLDIKSSARTTLKRKQPCAHFTLVNSCEGDSPAPSFAVP
jgi:hypothetical protein